MAIKQTIKSLPILGPMAGLVYVAARKRKFRGSDTYWTSRYTRGKDSGSGSYGKFAAFKAGVLNDFIRENAIESVIEFGCGDGNQLGLMECPRYLGYDISITGTRMEVRSPISYFSRNPGLNLNQLKPT